MSDQQHATLPGNQSRNGTVPFGLCVGVILVVYAVGLSRELTEPWVGMHDWNGAFYSQLARNLLRHPWSEHYGMPIVAVGENLPPADERSFYATHPPGLVWLLAAAFAMGGEAEWIARLVPLLASLGTLWLLVTMVARGRGREAAVFAGLIYAIMPMSVYFGRMVDQEAVCLFFMVAALASWRLAVQDRGSGRTWARVAWALAMLAAIWTDWSGVLFAFVFCLYALWLCRAGAIDRRSVVIVAVFLAVSVGAMVAHLVHAGLDGRWGDLVAIFLSRSGDEPGRSAFGSATANLGPWTFAVQNLTWPIIALAAAGAVIGAVRLLSGVASQRDRAGPVGRSAGIDDGLWIILITGAAWLLLFWRQYERHNYWLFYLGPAVAVFAGSSLASLRLQLNRLGNRAGHILTYVCVAVPVGCGLVGADDYFGRLWYPPDEVRAWQSIHDQWTGSGDRVVLFRDPVRVETRGGYVFRNVVPPQLAYYLDRSLDAESNLSAVGAGPAHAVLFVMPFSDTISHGRRLGDVRRRYPDKLVGNQVVFDLRKRVGPKPGGRED